MMWEFINAIGSWTAATSLTKRDVSAVLPLPQRAGNIADKRGKETEMKMNSITLPIYGLGCGGGGAVAAERVLGRLPGVAHVYVNPATEMAYVQYDPALADGDRLSAALAEAGFAPATHGRPAAQPLETATNQLDARRLALAAGLLLAGVFALCVVADLLFPRVFQMYRVWELLLIGVRWATPWTLLLGLVEAFVYGLFGGWAVAALYNALPGRRGQKLSRR